MAEIINSRISYSSEIVQRIDTNIIGRFGSKIGSVLVEEFPREPNETELQYYVRLLKLTHWNLTDDMITWNSTNSITLNSNSCGFPIGLRKLTGLECYSCASAHVWLLRKFAESLKLNLKITIIKEPTLKEPNSCAFLVEVNNK